MLLAAARRIHICMPPHGGAVKALWPLARTVQARAFEGGVQVAFASLLVRAAAHVCAGLAVRTLQFWN
jgi:hypothetical protein